MQSIYLPKLQKHTWSLDIIFLMLTLGSLFFILLGTHALSIPDEANYAEIVREMVASGNYITPYLNEIKFFEKPIFLYWLGTIAVKIGGLNLWSIRSVNASLALLGCLLTYFTARKIYDRRTGIFAALILGTSLLYFALAHMLTTDLTVTTFCTATLYAFLLGSHPSTNQLRLFYFWSAAAAAGFAVLTKGLIGLVLPGMIIIPWIMLVKEWRILKKAYLFSSLMIFLLVAAPWHILVSLANPEFFQYYFVNQHLLRYFTPYVGHPQPFWYYIPVLVFGFFPWIVFLPQTIANAFPSTWKKRFEYKNELYFVLWAVLIYIFFTISKTKLTSYILPMFPPLAILTAHYLSQKFDYKKSLGVKSGYIGLLIFSLGISCTFILFTHYWVVYNINITNLYLCLAAIVLMGGIILSYIYSLHNILKAVIATVATTYFVLLIVIGALPFVDPLTIRPLTNILKPILQSEDEVVAFNHHFQDLSFYLERRIYILNSRKLFEFGMQHQARHEWMIDNNSFSQLWHSNKRIFAIMHTDEYRTTKYKYPNEEFYLWGTTPRDVLVSNRPQSLLD